MVSSNRSVLFGQIWDVVNIVNLLTIFLKPIPSQHAEDSENRCAGIASSCTGVGDRTPEDLFRRRGPVGFFESTGSGVCGWRCNGVWVVPDVQSFSSVHSRRKSVSGDHHATVAFRVCHSVQPTTQAERSSVSEQIQINSR